MARLFLVAALPGLLASCASGPHPLTGLVPGREMHSLQSAVAVTMRQGDESRGGRGYLVFRRPDRFHLALLSPFGQSLLDIYSDGTTLTCLFPRERTAYRGSLAELPDREGVRLWGLMRWVVEQTPPAGPTTGTRDNITSDGRHERLTYDERGLVVSRESDNGDRIFFRDYASVEGIAFPLGIDLTDRQGMQVSVTFDEPELNGALDDETLTPALDGVSVLPFSAFTGF
jgi:outer membrane lipoprotein-sorting protein